MGDILVDAGVIDSAQLSYALTQRRDSQERLSALLVRLNLASEDLIVKGLSHQLKVPILNLAQIEIPDELLTLVPKEVLYGHVVIPVALKGIAGKQNLILAMGDPTDKQVIDWIKNRVTYNVRPGVAPESLIQTVLRRTFGPLDAAPVAAPAELQLSPLDAAMETEDHTASISMRIDLDADGEVTALTRQDHLAPAGEDHVLHELTEPTHPRVTLSETRPRPTAPATPPLGGAPAPEVPRGESEIREFVAKTNKNLLLEVLIQKLLEHKVLTLEELITLVELKK